MLSVLLTSALWVALGMACLLGIAGLLLGAFFVAWVREINLEADDMPLGPLLGDVKPAIVKFEYRRGTGAEFDRLMRALATLTSNDDDLVCALRQGVRVRLRMILISVPIKGRGSVRPTEVTCHGTLPLRRRPLADAIIALYGPVLAIPENEKAFDDNRREAGAIATGLFDFAHHIADVMDVPAEGVFTGHEMIEARAALADGLIAAGVEPAAAEMLLAA